MFKNKAIFKYLLDLSFCIYLNKVWFIQLDYLLLYEDGITYFLQIFWK